jgi:hypothetical protein
MIEQVASNKSSLLLHIYLQNIQTLQQFTMTIKTKVYMRVIKNAKLNGLGAETKFSN